jgi:quercetin dioxygenase-like cupin family protein
MSLSIISQGGTVGAALVLGLGLVCVTGCTQHRGQTRAEPSYEPFVRALPDTAEYTPLLGKGQAVGMRSGLVTLKPGESCGWHSTEEYEELILCLAGAGQVQTEGGGQRPISANHYAYNPPRTRHNVFNSGTEPMRYVYVVAPAGAE